MQLSQPTFSRSVSVSRVSDVCNKSFHSRGISFGRLSFFNCQTNELCKGQIHWSTSPDSSAFKASIHFSKRAAESTHMRSRCEREAKVTTERISILCAKSSKNKARDKQQTLWRSQLLMALSSTQRWCENTSDCVYIHTHTHLCLYVHTLTQSTCKWTSTLHTKI